MSDHRIARPDHTAGPWQVDFGPFACTNTGQRAVLAMGSDRHIAYVTSQIMRTRATKYNAPDVERDANARLIAAAPLLLAMLVTAVAESGFAVSGPTDWREADEGEPRWVSAARDVLGMATGQT